MSILDFIEEVCVQTAVYWGNPRANGSGGMSYDPPLEVAVRWEDKAKLLSDAKGKQFTTMSEVLVAGRREDDGSVTIMELDVDGRLFLGTLDDLDSGQEANPVGVKNCYPIRRFDKVPLFESDDEFVMRAYL